MNRDEVIRLAREACKPDAPFRQYVGGVDCGFLMKDEHLERFADLITKAERQKCAWLAENGGSPRSIATAIRARGNT